MTRRKRVLLWAGLLIVLAGIAISGSWFARFAQRTEQDNVRPETVDLSDIRPGPDGMITWDDAQLVLLHPDARFVTQSHDRIVRISLRDGRSYRTREPHIDAVLGVMAKHGLRKRIQFATE